MKKRRRFSSSFKRKLVDACSQPGASVASVALSHRINANQLHRWRRELIKPGETAALLPVRLVERQAIPVAPPHSNVAAGAIDIELPAARVRVMGMVDLPVLEAVLRTLGHR